MINRPSLAAGYGFRESIPDGNAAETVPHGERAKRDSRRDGIYHPVAQAGDCGAEMIAALYVQTNVVYYGLDDVDPWDVHRDARLYDGPWPVVAHPPCERWGRYWSGGPSAKVRAAKGADGGCFAAAISAVREFGGVIEHPEASHAWRSFSLNLPPRCGGWVSADLEGGWTCCVEQGHYGHRARKATWLYACGVHLPSLKWGRSSGERLDEGFHSSKERAEARARGVLPRKRLSTRENISTPLPFRDLLLSIARTAITATARREGTGR